MEGISDAWEIPGHLRDRRRRKYCEALDLGERGRRKCGIPPPLAADARPEDRGKLSGVVRACKVVARNQSRHQLDLNKPSFSDPSSDFSFS